MRSILLTSCSLLLSVSALAAVPGNARKAPEPEPVPFKPRAIDLDFCPGGVALDGTTLYITSVGMEPKTGLKDEDGGVAKLDLADENAKAEMITEKGMYNSPTGICLDGDYICVADVDNVFIFNKKTTELDGGISVSMDLPMTQLDGITALGDGRVVVASRDLNKLYIGDTRSKTFAEIVTKEPLFAPTGVFWDKSAKILYVTEAAREVVNRKEKPSGRLLAVDILYGTVTELEGMAGKKLRGEYGAIANDDKLFVFSDLSQEGLPEAMQRIDTKTKRVTNVAPLAMKGISHFLIHGNQLIVPAMKDKKIYIFNMKK